MKNIKTFEKFSFSKIPDYISNILKKGGKLAHDVWEQTKIEKEETKLAIGILSRLLKGEEVSEQEKKFLKEQSKDIAKILPLVAIQGIPIPVPITPLLIMLGKKYGFDFLPRDHRDILKSNDDKVQ